MKFKKYLLVMIIISQANLCEHSAETFTVEKKTIVSLASLKQECAQESICWLGAEQSGLLKTMGIAGETITAIASDLLDGTTKTPFAKPTKTKLESYLAQLKKIRFQAQQLQKSLDELASLQR